MRHLSIALLGLLSARQALGSPPDEKPIRLPSVVVRGQAPADEAAPSTVITRAEIQESITDLPQLLDEQPGLRAPRYGGLGSFTALRIRGSTTSQVRVVLDGIPLDSAEGGPVDLSTLPLGPIESLVVYRGVSPVRFGGSAIGGVLDVHTRTIETPTVELEAGGGSFSTRLARGFYGHGNGRWGVGISVDYLGGAGDFDFVNDRGTRFDTSDDIEVDRQNNAFDQLAAMVKGHVRTGAHVTLRALNLFTWRDMGLAGRGLDPTEQSRLSQQRNLTGLRLELDRLTPLRIHVAVSTFVSWSTTRFDDPLGEIGVGQDAVRDSSLSPGAGVLARIPVPLDADLGWLLTFRTSADYRFERFQPGTSDGSDAGRPSTRHRLTGAGEVSLVAEPIATEFVGSARWERLYSTLNLPDNRLELAPDPPDLDGEDVFTWRAALVQRSIPNTEIKINVADAVRFPSLFELFGNTGAVLGNPELRAERGLTVDLGVIHQASWLPAGNVWALQAHGFYTVLDDLIQLVPNSQNVLRAENNDSGALHGIEIGTWADVLSHLRVRGSLTWLESENTGDIKARKGNKLPQRPEWSVYGRLAGYHDFDRRAVGEIGGAFEVEHLAGNFLDPANLVEVPPRTTLTAAVWAKFWDDRLRFDLSVRNLLSSRVQDFAGFPLPGISVLASLRYAPITPFDNRLRQEKTQ